MAVVLSYTSISTSMLYLRRYRCFTNSEQLNGGLQNLFLRKFILSQNQGFYEILTLRKFGAIRYCVSFKELQIFDKVTSWPQLISNLLVAPACLQCSF